MVDMKAKPFYLSDEDCKWVEETIAGMTTEEKIGQLFFNMGSSRDEEYLKMTVDKYHIAVSATTRQPVPRCVSRTGFFRRTARFRLSLRATRRMAATAPALTEP